MNRIVLLSIFVLGLASHHASAAVVMKRVHSDIAGVDLVVSCDPGPAAADYAAETASGVALTDAYAVARGADKGLVDLMNQGGRRARQYVIPHRLIRAVGGDQDLSRLLELGLSVYQPRTGVCG